MFAYLLNLVYLAVLALASPVLIYRALRFGKYREGLAARFLGLVPERTGNGPCVWFHAVSVGEVNLLATLLESVRQMRPTWECVISTTTRTGYALARRKYPGLCVFYCPLDFTWSASRAMQRIRPSLLVLAELELWPNLLRAASQRHVRVAIVNGRLSQHSFGGYRRMGGLVGRWLNRIDVVAAQNEEYARRFIELGAPANRVHVTGSLKFDGAQTDRHNPATMRLRRLAGFGHDDLVFLAGSTQEPEEALALAACQALCLEFPRLRLVLVPRHPERFEAVARELDRARVVWQRRTGLDAGRNHDARILLVDAVGELGAWWGCAQIAFVGGSISRRGGQNMIEPAAYGAAVCFGPNTANFREVVEAMLAAQAAEVVHDGAELCSFVRRCLADPVYTDSLGRRASALVATQLGATRRTLALLDSLVEQPAEATARAA